MGAGLLIYRIACARTVPDLTTDIVCSVASFIPLKASRENLVTLPSLLPHPPNALYARHGEVAEFAAEVAVGYYGTALHRHWLDGAAAGGAAGVAVVYHHHGAGVQRLF